MRTEIFGMKAPKEACTDSKCPFHGDINVKKELLRGVVVRKDINHTATITWFRQKSVPKYERFEVRRSRLRVHNPACINANIGDNVVVARTRPLSKTKNHSIIGLLEGKGTKELRAEAAAREFGQKKKEREQEESGEEKSSKKSKGQQDHESHDTKHDSHHEKNQHHDKKSNPTIKNKASEENKDNDEDTKNLQDE
ncbi:30S ribosomal protein S17 [Candidatus Woesearchaeota archaeon]|nr:30S ribosomal protein S17 [Candidatus Woesearchaeota archaeon]